MSIYKKFLLALLPTVTIVFGAVFVYVEKSICESVELQLAVEFQNITQKYAALVADPLWNYDYELIETIAASASNEVGILSIEIFDSTGKAINKIAPISASAFQTLEETVTVSNAQTTESAGLVRIAFTDDRLVQIHEYLAKFALFLFVLTVASVWIAAWVFARVKVDKPLRRLNDDILAMANGQIRTEALPQSKDELSTIIRSFALMSTRLFRQQKQLGDREQNFRMMFNEAPVSMATIDTKGSIVSVNARFSALTGVESDELKGVSVIALLNGGVFDPRSSVSGVMPALGASAEIRGASGALIRANNEMLDLSLSLSREMSGLKGVTTRILTLSDVTQLNAANREIQRQASRDSLTGLLNREALTLKFKEMREAAGQNSSAAVLFFDIDKFKAINDELGHSAGDELLREVADRVAEEFSEESVVLGRVGGDEFVLLLSDVQSDRDVSLAAGRLCNTLRTTYISNRRQFKMSCSVGIALSPRDGSELKALMRCADLAMYRVKVDGGDGFEFYNDELDAAMQRKSKIAEGLRLALNDGGLYLNFQPIVNAETGNVCATEALLRAELPGLGTVGPFEFIPVAESHGLMPQIGNWVIRESIRQLADWRWRGLDPNLMLAINVSAQQFQGDELVTTLLGALEEFNVPGTNVCIEITESLLISDENVARRILDEIRCLGCCVALDDFGTEHSSITYLQKFPVDSIKIDRSFVSGCANDENKQLLIRSMTALAKSLDLRLVAEGVETEAELEICKEIGVAYCQGYYFAKPMMPAELEQYVCDVNGAFRESDICLLPESMTGGKVVKLITG